MRMRIRLRWCWWVALYAAFVVFAIALRNWVMNAGMESVWGWDYVTFVGQIGEWRWIGYFGFRHPGLGIVCSPLVVLQHLWSGAYLLVMPTIALMTAWLIWRMAGWLALGVWLIFPTTWLMAGIPESFPLAQLLLLLSVFFAPKWRGVSDTSRPCASGMLLFLLSVLNGMVTLTNGVKPIVAYVVSCGDWKKLAKVVGATAALLALGLGIFVIRAGATGRGIGAGFEATLSWIPETRNLPREAWGFFVRPVGILQSCMVYPLFLLAIYRLVCTHRVSSLVLLAAYFAVDVLIHWIIGWGMSESWVFAPHWIWMLPLVIGCGLKGDERHENSTCRAGIERALERNCRCSAGYCKVAGCGSGRDGRFYGAAGLTGEL